MPYSQMTQLPSVSELLLSTRDRRKSVGVPPSSNPIPPTMPHSHPQTTSEADASQNAILPQSIAHDGSPGSSTVPRRTSNSSFNKLDNFLPPLRRLTEPSINYLGGHTQTQVLLAPVAPAPLGSVSAGGNDYFSHQYRISQRESVSSSIPQPLPRQLSSVLTPNPNYPRYVDGYPFPEYLPQRQHLIHLIPAPQSLHHHPVSQPPLNQQQLAGQPPLQGNQKHAHAQVHVPQPISHPQVPMQQLLPPYQLQRLILQQHPQHYPQLVQPEQLLPQSQQFIYAPQFVPNGMNIPFGQVSHIQHPHVETVGTIYDDNSSLANKRRIIKRRTRTGCLTCRKRRIKCDETKPTCYNCERSKKVCLGYENLSHIHSKKKRDVSMDSRDDISPDEEGSSE